MNSAVILFERSAGLKGRANRGFVQAAEADQVVTGGRVCLSSP